MVDRGAFLEILVFNGSRVGGSYGKADFQSRREKGRSAFVILNWFDSHKDITCVIMGTAFGMAARIFMLRSDYRQYPAYPHGKIIHLALGLIAGALGSVAVPALYNKDYTAITFLSLAAQQFREVRNMERNTLTAIDHLELVPRGRPI